MKRHASKVHRRVFSSLSPNSPQNSEASQMRDRLSVAREQLDDLSLLSRGVLSFHHNDSSVFRSQSDFTHIEDNRRRFDEQKFQRTPQRHFLISGKVAEHGYNRPVSPVSVQSRMFWMPERVRDEFYNPRQTLVCVRRQVRRNVLFALRQIGKGSGAKRRARWSEASRIVCRRR